MHGHVTQSLVEYQLQTPLAVSVLSVFTCVIVHLLILLSFILQTSQEDILTVVAIARKNTTCLLCVKIMLKGN